MKHLLYAFPILCSISHLAVAETPKFHRQAIDEEIQIGYGLSIGHVNDDEKLDILLADKTEIVWYENPGDRSKPWTRHVMARNLTTRDNVCIAARDITGDGLVEVAVGANWNPGETSNAEASGASFYLQRPGDPTKPWKPVPLPEHQPTTHRMHWLKYSGGFGLAVLPLHGVGNKSGSGKSVSIGLYDVSSGTPTLHSRVNTDLHMTHNFEFLTDPELGKDEFMLVAGKEGYSAVTLSGDTMPIVDTSKSKGGGEARRYPIAERAFVGIEPMHGTEVVLYRESSPGSWSRELLDADLSQGHALAAADLTGDSRPEVVAGWRGKNSKGKVGIKIYQPTEKGWQAHMLDDSIACEDLKISDLDADGKADIIAAGRATKNVIVYWNQN